MRVRCDVDVVSAQPEAGWQLTFDQEREMTLLSTRGGRLGGRECAEGGTGGDGCSQEVVRV